MKFQIVIKCSKGGCTEINAPGGSRVASDQALTDIVHQWQGMLTEGQYCQVELDVEANGTLERLVVIDGSISMVEGDFRPVLDGIAERAAVANAAAEELARQQTLRQEEEAAAKLAEMRDKAAQPDTAVEVQVAPVQPDDKGQVEATAPPAEVAPVAPTQADAHLLDSGHTTLPAKPEAAAPMIVIAHLGEHVEGAPETPATSAK